MLGRPKWESVKTFESTFDAALKEGNRKFTMYKILEIVPIKAARKLGILPMQ